MLATKRDALTEKLHKQDSLIENLQKMHGQGNDKFAALVGQEAHEVRRPRYRTVVAVV